MSIGTVRGQTVIVSVCVFSASLLRPPDAAAQTPPCPTWAERVFVTGRYLPAMAYDSARGVAVAFGGVLPNGLSGETWERGAGSWALRSTGGPSPRGYTGMAYDSARGVTVLFGGFDSFAFDHANNETWEWNGSTWTLRSTTGPAPRAAVGMAYDAARGVTVLYGGLLGAAPYDADFADTWEWDGNTWTQRASSGPPALYNSGFVYDAGRGVTVLFGGYTSTVTAETWEWDGNTWTLRATGGPSARTAPGMSYDGGRSRTVLFGGYDGSYFADTWEWDGTKWTQRPVSGPSNRGYEGMVYDSGRGRSVLFGGFFHNPPAFYDDTWEFDGSAWTLELTSNRPTARYVFPMVYESTRGVTLLFGGYPLVSDTLSWNGNTWRLLASSGPSVRTAAVMAYDSGRGRTVLFGGYDGSYFADTWEWDGNAWSYLTTSGPSPRGYGEMVYDSARGVSIMFGGFFHNPATSYGDTWTWNGTAWTLAGSSGPTPRYKPGMAFDTARGVAVLYGGYTPAGPVAETWEWNGSAWTQRAVSGPGPRAYMAMTYDGTRGVTVLHGGFDDPAATHELDDTWQWDGIAWTLCSSGTPSARLGSAMVYDSARHVSVLFGGGADGGYFADTWELGTPSSDAPPTAMAGPDQAIHAGSRVFLNGSTSFDDNTPSGSLSYDWIFVLKPLGSNASVADPHAAMTSFVTDLLGTYELELVVRDNLGQPSSPDQIVISSTNLAPTANAGLDQAKMIHNAVLLSGAASSDPEMDPLTYQWTLVQAPAGSTAFLVGDSHVVCSLVPDLPGPYVARLVVNDGFGPSLPDAVLVTAITGGQFVENTAMSVISEVAALPPASVTTAGNRQAFSNFMSQVIQSVQSNNLAQARMKLGMAIARTDGCALRGQPDTNGPGRDWILNCQAQSSVYIQLVQALNAISP